MTRSMSGIFCSTTSSIRARPGTRERYEAIARSVRDVLSQRWLHTERLMNARTQTGLLSFHGIPDRALADEQYHQPSARARAERAIERRGSTGSASSSRSRMPGWETVGSADSPHASSNSMATMQLPAMGYGLRYEYGIFKQAIQNGWQNEQPDNWLREPDPWEVARPQEQLKVKLGCSFEVRGGTLRAFPAALDTRWPAIRSPGGRLRRQDHQHVAALGRRRARLFRFPGIQCRRIRQRAGRDGSPPNR